MALALRPRDTSELLVVVVEDNRHTLGSLFHHVVAMHHGLRIAEILDNIFSNLLTEDDALACLARTCRIFMDPALDALWSRQTTLNNILKCLPLDCWEETVKNAWRPKRIRLLRPPKAADWRIASKYHTRVRFLELYFGDDNFPSSELFEALSSAFPAEGIFPNLRGLEWRYLLDKTPSPPVFQHIRLFASPRLTALHLNFRTDEELSLVLALPLALQKLQKLVMVSSKVSSVYYKHPDSTAFTLKLSAIRELCLPPISNETFSHLSTLPELSELEIFDTREESSIMLLPLPFEARPFAALVSLCLRGSTVDFALQWVEAVSVWRLEYFLVEFIDPAPKSHISALYQTIASRFSPSQLCSLIIGKPGEEGDMDPPLHELDEYAVSGDSLDCLFRFSHLTHVILESAAGFIIDDAQIWNLARSWTALDLLILGTGSSLQARPTTTIDALRAFAMHCSELQRLTIAVDATNVPAFETYRQQHIIQTNLHWLDVKESPIDDSGCVVSFLSGMFVGLSSVETSQSWRWEAYGYDYYDMQRDEEEQEREHYERWKEVEKLLPVNVSAAARRQERWQTKWQSREQALAQE
ncbi:hypothetical protein C8F01DRAFT_1370119 [Mycena amicta]|nr:hypothetical protein C8F01DRAFT_1370119 [Mycena amicta]